MSRLQIIDARKMEKLLFRLGFERVRQKGSHVFYRHIDGRTTSTYASIAVASLTELRIPTVLREHAKANVRLSIRTILRDVFNIYTGLRGSIVTYILHSVIP